MPYGLDQTIQLGPRSEKRFAELAARVEEDARSLKDVRALLATRQQEQQTHAFALAGVNIESDPRELATSYGLRAAHGEIIGVIEKRVAEAERRYRSSRDAFDKLVGSCNGDFAGARTWDQRGDHAYAEGQKLRDPWLQ